MSQRKRSQSNQEVDWLCLYAEPRWRNTVQNSAETKHWSVSRGRRIPTDLDDSVPNKFKSSGFSIVVSDTSETGASVESVNGSAMLASEPENSAQQIAQHERSAGAGGVGFPDVRERSAKDPALRFLVEVWGELPDSVKHRILSLADDAVSAVR